MKTIRQKADLKAAYPLERLGPLKDLLFFDIETTGFMGGSSSLYLIGCAHLKGNSWELVQWFADSADSEPLLLTSFFTFLKNFRVLVHFNGDSFDLPFLVRRCQHYGLDFGFGEVSSVDIYRRIKPYRRLLGMESLKQTAVEDFLGIRRKDQFTGGQLIKVYQEYLATRSEPLLELLLLHNADDLRGMLNSLPILSYADLLERPLALTAERLTDSPSPDAGHPGASRTLCLAWESDCHLPAAICPAPRYPVLSLELRDNRIACRIALRDGELKYFYPDYQNYYYLPCEDTAVHKSVGAYVDRSARKQAAARTCYTRCSGLFLPQFKPQWEPRFQEAYGGGPVYAKYSPQLLAQEGAAREYLNQILRHVTCGEPERPTR